MRTAASPNQTTVRKDRRKVDIKVKNYYLGHIRRETTALSAA